MVLKTSKIPLLAEENYLKSLWCTQILSGIGKHKYAIFTAEELKSLPENSAVPIIGSTNHFLKKNILLCRTLSLRPIVVGTEIADLDSRISSIKTNRKAAIAGLIHYCQSSGRGKSALLGINPYSNIDNEKREAFLETLSAHYDTDASESVYYNDTASEECINLLFDDISRYDSVICSNDYFAAMLITEASRRGIKVPDDIFVTGYGNTFIGQCTLPSITTVAPKYYELGIQTAKIYNYLTDNPEVTSLELLVDYDVIVRESTANTDFKTIHHADTGVMKPCVRSMFDDEQIRAIMGIDSILGFEDKTLRMILKGIANDEPYNALAEKLYLSDSAFRYKLNKIFDITHIRSKSELKTLVKKLNLKED